MENKHWLQTRLQELLLLAAMLTGCYSCEQIIDFPESADSEALPVIEAVLIDKPEVQKVRVSYSTMISDSNAYHLIEDAQVRVISGDGDTVTYSYDADGWYFSPVYAAKAGVEYTLEVITGEVTYRSSAQVIAMNGIDSLYSKYQEAWEGEPAGYYVYMNAGPANQEDTHYYQINFTCNDTLKTLGSELWLFSDLYAERIDNLKLPVPLSENDSVAVELLSLSAGMYDYYYKLAYEVLNLNLSNISYRTNLPSLFEPKALGYFQVSAVSRKTIVVGKGASSL
ncbi:MAG: DUF4249 domain-containing protein [Bacteroidales bacterium]|nr:DUF4249 domain-containing protein [Bacteroidales bacterium]